LVKVIKILEVSFILVTFVVNIKNMSEELKESDKLLEQIILFIKKLPQKEKEIFAIDAIYNIVAYAGYDDLGKMGILGCAEAEIVKRIINVDEDIINNN
jgi:hypothetical protein